MEDKEIFREFIRKNYTFVATAPLPQNIQQDLALNACCIGGAELVEDIRFMLQNAGFKEIKMIAKENSHEII